MPWWLWIFAILLILIAVVLGILILLTHIDRAKSDYSSEIDLHSHEGKDNKTLVVYLPGLIAHGEDSSKPLIETWLKHGDVLTVSYTGDQFNANAVTNLVAQHLESDKYHDKFVIIGSSMGGLLALDIVDQLRQDGHADLVAASSIIFVDSPSGSKDMLNFGNIGAPLMRVLPFGAAFNKRFSVPFTPPKDGNIEDHLDKAQIKAQAAEDMGKFPLSIWRDQLVYMASHEALKSSDFEGLGELIYMRSDLNNETVKQPQAAQTWLTAAPDLKVVGVNSTHCGYLERPLTWNAQFEWALQRVTVSP